LQQYLPQAEIRTRPIVEIATRQIKSAVAS
jgi:hypothetical protein